MPKSSEAQLRAQKKYAEKNREKKRIYILRSSARRFIKEYMTLEEVEEFKQLMAERIEKLKGEE